MIAFTPVCIFLPSLFRLLARPVFVFLPCLFAFSIPAQGTPSENALEVERLIAQGSYGLPPILWFSQSPEVNRGSGSKTWRAVSGGRLTARNLDPWGRIDAAFGPAIDAAGGAAVSGSTTYNIISPRQGSMICFCRPDSNTKPPMLLFALSDWGEENYFSLRVNSPSGTNQNANLTFAVADPGNKNKASQFEFASLAPNEWSFVAFTWREHAGIRLLNYWAGSLSSGELVEGQQDFPPMSDRPGTLVIGGRRAEEAGSRPGLTFTNGLLSQFAIYDSVLTDDTVKRIYLAATRR